MTVSFRCHRARIDGVGPRCVGLITRQTEVRTLPGPSGDTRRNTAKPCNHAESTGSRPTARLRLASRRIPSHRGSGSHSGRIEVGSA